MDKHFLAQLKERDYDVWSKGFVSGILAILLVLIYFQVANLLF